MTIQERRFEFSARWTAARWVALDDLMNKDFFQAIESNLVGLLFVLLWMSMDI